MFAQTLYHTFKRYHSIQTDRISALPIVILMPHSACNCRCVMCDIWKDNKNLKQLEEADINGLLESLKRYGTQQVVMSGGEALLNPNFFRFCEILRKQNIKISLLSTGLSIERQAEKILHSVNDLILSLDGPAEVHDRIRNIKGAFNKLKGSVQLIKSIDPSFPITARTVIHRLNFRYWEEIIETAKEINLDRISFLPADVSSHAFNREVLWTEPRQHEILPGVAELPALYEIIEHLIEEYHPEFDARFIAESPDKIRKIYAYYAAFYGLNSFPFKKCNAPWVSTVIEADGTVRPCFFHEALGNIRENSLNEILNSKKSIEFRRSLEMDSNPTCMKCVCYLNLSPGAKV